jgi:hypothetical protein
MQRLRVLAWNFVVEIPLILNAFILPSTYIGGLPVIDAVKKFIAISCRKLAEERHFWGQKYSY